MSKITISSWLPKPHVFLPITEALQTIVKDKRCKAVFTKYVNWKAFTSEKPLQLSKIQNRQNLPCVLKREHTPAFLTFLWLTLGSEKQSLRQSAEDDSRSFLVRRTWLTQALPIVLATEALQTIVTECPTNCIKLSLAKYADWIG